MATVIAEVKTRTDPSDLRRTEKNIENSLGKVASSFSDKMKSITRTLALGAIVATVGSVLGKISANFKSDMEFSLNVLKQAKDIVEESKLLDVKPEELMAVQSVGIAKGLTKEDISMALQKFSTAREEAKERVAKGEDAGSLGQFLEGDTLTAFKQFMQSLEIGAKLQGGEILDTDKMNKILMETFGGRNALKFKDLIGTDFEKEQKSLGITPELLQETRGAIELGAKAQKKYQEYQAVDYITDLKDAINPMNSEVNKGIDGFVNSMIKFENKSDDIQNARLRTFRLSEITARKLMEAEELATIAMRDLIAGTINLTAEFAKLTGTITGGTSIVDAGNYKNTPENKAHMVKMEKNAGGVVGAFVRGTLGR